MNMNAASSSTLDRGPQPSPARDRYPVLIIVEDDTDDFTLLKRALWKTGASARVWWAKTCAEALEILAQVSAGNANVCIVSDIKLPDLDGFELLRMVKSLPGEHHPKFVFLTGNSDAAASVRAQRLGADGFFAKPIRWDDLVETARALQKLALQV